MLYKPNVPACRAVTYRLYSQPCDGECNNNNNNDDNRIHVRIHVRMCANIILPLSFRLWISREKLPPVIFHIGIFGGASSRDRHCILLLLSRIFFFVFRSVYILLIIRIVICLVCFRKAPIPFERHQISSDDIYVRVVVVAKKNWILINTFKNNVDINNICEQLRAHRDIYIYKRIFFKRQDNIL